MVIDASRSPVPQWRRLARYVVLLALIVVISMLIWTKELHPSVSKSTHKSHGAAIVLTTTRSV